MMSLERAQYDLLIAMIMYSDLTLGLPDNSRQFAGSGGTTFNFFVMPEFKCPQNFLHSLICYILYVSLPYIIIYGE